MSENITLLPQVRCEGDKTFIGEKEIELRIDGTKIPIHDNVTKMTIENNKAVVFAEMNLRVCVGVISERENMSVGVIDVS